MTMELRARPKEVMRAVEAFQEFAREQKMPEKLAHGLALALEECGSNIVNHALKGDARRKFRISIERQGAQMVIELRDKGPAFDPLAFNASPSRHEDEEGGWGIQIVRRFTDAVSYRREGRENVLRLMKLIGEFPGPTSNL
jgi:anti-sigma regulatory factor (Ser/Thr protein kinase)